MDMNKRSYAETIADQFAGAEVAEVHSYGKTLTSIRIPVECTGEVKLMPNFYIDEMYEIGMDTDEAADRIKLWLSDPDVQETQRDLLDAKLNFLTKDWDSIKEDVTPVLRHINSIKDPDIIYDDLNEWYDSKDIVIQYRLILGECHDGVMAVTIGQTMLDRLNITQPILRDQAFKNLNMIIPNFMPLDEMLASTMLGVDIPEDNRMKTVMVITNDTGIDGAQMILHRCITQDEDFKNFYFIPSSRHEVLAVPKELIESQEYLNRMIAEINYNIVSDKDFLSDKSFSLI